MKSTSTRPWYRLNAVTWLVAAAVIATLARCQTASEGGGGPLIFGGYVDVTLHGWPLLFIERTAQGERNRGPGPLWGPITKVDYDVSFRPLCWNVAAWLALLVGTLVPVERWLRRDRRWQLRVGDMLMITAVVAVLLGCWYREYHAFDDAAPVIQNVKELFRDMSRTPFLGDWIPWYVRLPLLAAVGAAIGTGGWLALRFAAWPIKRLRLTKKSAPQAV